MATENPYAKYRPAPAPAPTRQPAPITMGQPRATAPFDVPQAQADLRGAEVRTEAVEATLPYAAPQAAVDLARSQAELDAAQREVEENARKDESRKVQKSLASDNVLSVIQRARNLIMENGGVGWGASLSLLPATEARALKGYLGTIRSNLTFDELQKMRENSPTGGAVGNASDNDMRLLGSTVADLDQFSSMAKVMEDLARIETHYAGFKMSLEGIDPTSEQGVALLSEYTSPEYKPDGQALSQRQQQLMDAFYSANPNFTADQLRQFASSINVPISNADEIVQARDVGRGLAPAARAEFAPSDGQGAVSQGMSGVNEGIASVLGLPVDVLTGAINATTGGMNWLNEAVGGSPEANLPRIENPVGGGQWMRDQFGGNLIGPQALTDDGAWWRRAGQSVGAASVPGLGLGTTPRMAVASLLSGAGGGSAAATAQEMAPGNTTAEIIAELAGGVAGGLPAVGLSTRAARNDVRAAVPTSDQLRENAGNLYAQAEQRGIVSNPSTTDALIQGIEDIARREALVSARGNVSEAYPKIGPILKTIRDEGGQSLNPKRIQVLRETLADAAYTTEGREQRIAQDMLREFDGATVPLAPELSDARNVASRYLQARPIEQAIELASSREGQFSQSGWDNALRTDFANLQRREIRGNENFRPEVVEAIAKVANPSGLRGAARWLGRLSPNSQLGIGLSGSPAGIGYLAGEPYLGAAISGAMAGAGWLGRGAAGKLAQQEAQDAALMARSGGTMALPNASDTGSYDAVVGALGAQAAPYSQEEDARAQIERELLLNILTAN